MNILEQDIRNKRLLDLPKEPIQRLIENVKRGENIHIIEIILFMQFNEVKPTEIMHICETDIDQNNKIIFISGVKKKYLIPIHQFTFDLLEYLKSNQNPKSPIFNVPLDDLLNVVNGYFEKTGFSKDRIYSQFLGYTWIASAFVTGPSLSTTIMLFGHPRTNNGSTKSHFMSCFHIPKGWPIIEFPFTNFFVLIGDSETISNVYDDNNGLKNNSIRFLEGQKLKQ